MLRHSPRFLSNVVAKRFNAPGASQISLTKQNKLPNQQTNIGHEPQQHQNQEPEHNQQHQENTKRPLFNEFNQSTQHRQLPLHKQPPPLPEHILSTLDVSIPAPSEHSYAQTFSLTPESALSELLYSLDSSDLVGVRAVHDYMHANRIPNELRTYNRLLSFYSRHQDHAGVRMTQDDMARQGVIPDITTYLALLHYASERNHIADFDSLLTTIKGMHLSLDHKTSLFNMRLKNTLQRNNTKERIASILEEMRVAGIAPDEYTYSSILRYHAQKKDLKQCLSVLGEMHQTKTPITEVVFEPIFDACTTDQQVNDVQGLLKKLGLRMNAKAYNMRIRDDVKNDNFARCFEWMSIMSKEGVVPDRVTYNTIIGGLAKKQMMQECNAVLAEMINNEVQPDATTYTLIVTAWATHHHFERALELVGIMRSKHLRTDHAMAAILFNLITSGQMNKGLELFQQLVAEGITEVGMFNAAMSGLLEVGALHECDKVMAAMRQNNAKPDHITYQTLVSIAMRLGQDVLPLRDAMRADNVDPDEKMLYRLLRNSAGPPKRELELIRELHTKGFEPPYATYLQVMLHAAHTGDTDTCTKVFEFIRERKFPLNSQPYHLMVEAHIVADNDAGVWEGVAEMRRLKVGPTDRTYRILLDYLERHKKWEECVEMLEEMENNHVEPVGLWQ